VLSFPESQQAAQVLFLIGSSYRRLDEHQDSLNTFQELVKRYPNSDLADDAMAEIGVHYLLVESNRRKAEEYFEKVVKLYPKGNAADNALNWIAWDHLQNREYVEAAASYSRLASQYAEGRRAKIAQATLNILRKERTIAGAVFQDADRGNSPPTVVKAKETEGIFSWLTRPWQNLWVRGETVKAGGVFVHRVQPGSVAEKAGLRSRDKIDSIDLQNVESFQQFRDALNSREIGQLVTLRVRRDGKSVDVRGPVVDSYVYEKQ